MDSILETRVSLERLATSHPEVWELRPRILRDPRGIFLETYHRDGFKQLGISDEFVQDNHSISVQGTLRGLHYQLTKPQTKLCRVVEGEALDVAVDIRLGSPKFAAWTSVRLSAAIQNQIYIPAGFAHGFLALSERVQLVYKCSEFYDREDEHGILWSDPEIGIAWNIEHPLLSDRDSVFPTLAQMPRDLLPQF